MNKPALTLGSIQSGLTKLLITCIALIAIAISPVYAQGGGGGGGGGGISGTSIGCGDIDAFSLGNSGFTGDDPTTATGSCGQCCYAGSDLDGDGDQDVSFSTENGVWYEYCNNTGAAIDIDIIVDETNNDCNLQGAVFVGPTSGNNTIDCSNSENQEYGSNMNGNADGFSFSNVTVPDGECAYIFIDGYAGAACGAATIEIVCPCIPPIVTATASPTTVCSGQTVTLTGAGASTYTWSGSNLNSTSGTSVTANPTSSTTYTVTGDDGSGCTADATVTVTVTPPPVPDAGPDQSGCAGETFTIGADPVYGVEGADYSWSSGANGTLDLSGGGQDHGTTDVNPGSTTTYTLTIDEGGCIGTDQVTITINPLVTPTFTQEGPYCEGDAASALPTTSTNSITGTWDNAVSTASAGTTTYTFTPDAGQCANTSTMDIDVNATPVPDAGPDQTDCAGTTFTIGADPVYNVAGAAYSWSNGTNGILDLQGGGQDHGTTDVSPGSSTTYTLSVTDGGCTGTDQMIVTIDPCGLPVTLASFNVDCEVYPILSWSTFTEINNDYFEIEKACSNEEFKSIAQVNGSGTTSEMNEYRFVDRTYSSCDEDVYYRLSQVDTDGQREGLGVISLPCKKILEEPEIRITQDHITVNFNNEFSASLHSLEGKLIKSAIGEDQLQIDASDLSTGTYYLIVKGVNAHVKKVMLIK